MLKCEDDNNNNKNKNNNNNILHLNSTFFFNCSLTSSSSSSTLISSSSSISIFVVRDIDFFDSFVVAVGLFESDIIPDCGWVKGGGGGERNGVTETLFPPCGTNGSIIVPVGGGPNGPKTPPFTAEERNAAAAAR
ncbi:hypothetical protein BLOT_010244 [Blomia tropicalis]|nr:hypothetical protein BLOT_010244 [Blomia tropicalis]